MEIVVTYNLTDIRELAKTFPVTTRREIETVMDLIVRRLEKDVVEGTPRGVGAEGGLAGSEHGQRITQGEQVIGIVGTPMEHGEVIEQGRRPGSKMPPSEKLITWVRTKLGITNMKEARSIAYVIARRIAASGFKSIPQGAKMFQKAWDKDESWVQGQLNSIPERVVKKVKA